MRTLIITLLFAAICGLHTLHAQKQQDPARGAWMDRVGVGGNLGLRFGDITYVEVSPMAGYRLGPFLMPGVGLSYRYIQYRYPFRTNGMNIWGGSVWLRAYPLEMIFAYVEHEELYGTFDPYLHPQQKYFIGTNFVGAGYTQGLGNSSTYIMVLFALNQDYNSIYQNPVIRIGFMFGGNSD